MSGIWISLVLYHLHLKAFRKNVLRSKSGAYISTQGATSIEVHEALVINLIVNKSSSIYSSASVAFGSNIAFITF